MENIATITSKGQVVIPKQIRTTYSLNPQTKIKFEGRDGFVVLKPIYTNHRSVSLNNKLSKFSIDQDFRKSWEKSLEKKLKQSKW